MNVLLTGVGGFIGAHCLDYFLENTEWHITGVDSWEHKGSWRRIIDLLGPDKLQKYDKRFNLLKHDLTVPFTQQDLNLIHRKKIVNGHIIGEDIDLIINMASDSAVERSSDNPVLCLKNNYHLMINMLEYARVAKPKIFFHVSTDEVYGEAAQEESHAEWSTIAPSNPYAASKAAQEAMAMAYWRCFDVPVVITNTINNYGEAQDPEKFLPKIIQKVLSGQEMPIYADDEDTIGTRFYLHAKDHADVFLFLSSIKPSMYNDGENQRLDRYNVCGDVELNNLELAKKVAKMAGKKLNWKLVPPSQIRKGYDRRYCLDGTKLKEIGWSPSIDFSEGLKNLVDWTIKHDNWKI